jgi:hypothetical protein
MDAHLEMLSNCGVEVSGWDAAENFFVERTALHWRGDTKKEIRLRSSLHEGAIVFLRLLHPRPGRDNFPVAYRATRVEPPNGDGKSHIQLSPLRRRDTHKEEFARWTHSIRVA